MSDYVQHLGCSSAGVASGKKNGHGVTTLPVSLKCTIILFRVVITQRVTPKHNPRANHAAIVVQRAVRLRHELALDWPGIAVALTLMDDIAHLKQENRLLRQRLSRFVAHP